jgi:hypothetical protein
VLAASAMLVLAGVSGCGGGDDEEPQAAAPPPPPPPQWELADIEMHPKVQFPEKFRPRTEMMAQSIADFASAFAVGDGEQLEQWLSAEDQVVLEFLMGSGDWSEAASGINAVRVVNLLDEGGSAKLGLGIEDANGAFMLAWDMSGSGDSATFRSFAIEPQSALTAAMLDGAPMVPPVFEANATPLPPMRLPEEERRSTSSSSSQRNNSPQPAPGRLPIPRPGRPPGR